MHLLSDALNLRNASIIRCTQSEESIYHQLSFKYDRARVEGSFGKLGKPIESSARVPPALNLRNASVIRSLFENYRALSGRFWLAYLSFA